MTKTAEAERPKTALDAQRGTIFYLEPERIRIATAPAQPCYDKRVMKPITEQWVRNIKSNGVRRIIHVWKDGDDVWVADGRRRTRGAVEANKLIVKEGGTPIKVRCLLERGTNDEMFALSVIANEGNEEDDILTRAEKANRLLSIGQSIEDVADIFTKSVATVERWLKLLDADEEVQARVRSGDISPSMAIELSVLPREQQRAKATEWLGSTVAPTIAIEDEKSPPVPEKLSAERIREEVAKVRDPKAVKASEAKRKLLQAALDFAASDDYADTEALVKAAMAYAKSKRKGKKKEK